MRYSIPSNIKYSSIKMNWQKEIFHWKKWSFEPTENSVHTTGFFVLGNALLARLYLSNIYLK